MILHSKRLYAFGGHFLFSLLLIFFISAFSLLFWFPSPFFYLDGTLTAIIIIASVDLVLGPIVTLVIAAPSKSKQQIIKDMAVVIVLQLSALAYGMQQIYDQRIVAIVANTGVFHLVSHKDAARHAVKFEQFRYLPSYKGVYYGQVTDNSLSARYGDGVVNQLYNPALFTPLSDDTHYMEIPYERLPEAIKKYSQNSRFAIVAGKNNNGVAVINNESNQIEVIAVFKDEL